MGLEILGIHFLISLMTQISLIGERIENFRREREREERETKISISIYNLLAWIKRETIQCFAVSGIYLCPSIRQT